MIKERTTGEFLETLASKAPIPGGGGASGLAGALGAALGQMVGNLTVGKKRYADVEEEITELIARLHAMQEAFTRLAERDEEVFAPLAQAYRLPTQTEEERAYKDAVMEERLLAGANVPLEMMERSVELLQVLEILGEKGSRMAISDVGVGVQFARCALLGAAMNVYINTKSMKNRDQAEAMNKKAESLSQEGSALADRIYANVLAGLR